MPRCNICLTYPCGQALPTEIGSLLGLRWLTMSDNKLEERFVTAINDTAINPRI